ncbi:MAG: ATP-binding protein [Candidatus Limnocylindrales bacterium]|jgi:ATP-dependent DNA helicase RecG
MAPKSLPTTIDQLRLLPEDDRVRMLVDRREDQWFDRSSARVRARALADVMIGFANAEGGLIVLGIHDGRVEGISDRPAAQNEWRQAGRDFASPPVPTRFELIPCTTTDGDSGQLLLVEVEASEHVHENVKSDVYLRVGDENRRLGPLEVQEIRFDKGGTFYDGTACADASLSDLDDGLVRGFLKALGVTSRGEDALAARGLLVAARRRRYVPTVAGMLTLGKDPQRYFPEARLRLLRYEGTRAETGRRANVVDDVWVDGALRSQIVGARRRLRGWLRTATRLGSHGRFARSTIIPEDAWLEAIVNAVIHRSYSLAGDHIRVSLFADRLEVESPGRLPGLVRVETIRTTRYARNPRIARAILEFGFGRELGEGVDRMFDEMELAGLPDPLFRQGPASVTVSLLMDPLGARMLRVLPPGSERLVEHLLVNRRVSTAEARELLGVSVNTARRYLTILEENGFVDHVAKSARDPHGYWRLAGVGP